MDYYEALRKQVEPVELTPTSTSYFSKPVAGLDPRLFINGSMVPSVRNIILSKLLNYFKLEYYNPEAWTRAWLAGSGVSYQWAAQRDPADLDCLVGIDYPKFRQANEEYAGLSDREIASLINEGFRDSLNKEEGFMDVYELTFYVNVKSNIEEIKPYAAYSLTDDNWTVTPNDDPVSIHPEWESAIQEDVNNAKEIIERYGDVLNKIKAAPNDAIRRNHEAALAHIVGQASAMYKDIHERRSEAFSQQGEGYYDFNNYRWQAGKRSGVVPALKKLHQISKASKQVFNEETYGLDLPDASILIRRASTRPRYY